MHRLVLPAFRGYSLREIEVARRDALLKQLGNSYSSAKRARTVLWQSFALAVRHEVLARNPIDHVSRLHKTKRTPTALTATEVNAIRRRDLDLPTTPASLSICDAVSYDLSRQAEAESPVICECCGQPGRLTRRGGRGWYKTLCSACSGS